VSAPAVLFEALAVGATFELEGERVVVRAPAPLPPELLERLRAEREAVRAALRRGALTAADVDQAKVTAALELAVEGLALTVPELLDALDPEERDEPEAGLLEPELLRAFAVALIARCIPSRLQLSELTSYNQLHGHMNQDALRL